MISQSATDGTNQLRYTAGFDADAYIGAKAGVTGEQYIDSVKQMFGLK